MLQPEARADALSGLAWIALGAVVIVLSLQMDDMSYLGATFYTAPGFVPMLLGGSLIVLGGVLSARALAGRIIAWRQPGERHSLGRALLAIALLLIFSLGLVGRIPFWLATLVFVSSFIFLFERQAPPPQSPIRLLIKALVVAGATAAVVTFVFQEIFLVRLP